MDINLIGFDVTLGKEKPRTMTNADEPCPFCDTANLKDIVEQEGSVIFLRNKYNVIKGAEQFVLIESDLCRGDMPDYSCEKDSEFGLPRFILQNDDTIRWANSDERNELLHLGNHKN